MRRLDLFNLLNKKVSLKSTKVMEVKKYYLSLYRASMVTLYKEGYISDPTSFNTKEIYRNIVDLKINYLFDVSGRITLGEEYIKYAKARGTKEQKEFLELLYPAIKYKNISENLDLFFDSNNFLDKSSNKVSHYLKISGSKVEEKTVYKVDEGILSCLNDGVVFDFISLNNYVYDMALKLLKVENNTDKSVFVSGISKSEEIECVHLILDGLVKADGIYKDKLENYLNNHKWSREVKFSSDKVGLYTYITEVDSQNMLNAQSSLLQKLIEMGNTVVGMRTNGYFVISNKDTIKIPIGIFAVVGDETIDYTNGEEIDVFLPEINVLEGYSGEVYSLEFLLENDIPFVGSPIELYVNNKEKYLFVDREQTDMKDFASWFSLRGEIEFYDTYSEEDYFQTGSVEELLYRGIKASDCGDLIVYYPKDKIYSLPLAKKNVIRKVYK